MFGIEKVLPAEQQSLPPFLRADDMLLTNARSALWLLVRHLRPRNVWLPAFNCPDVIRAFEWATAIHFYDRGDLTWANQVKPDDMVLVLDEFGFPYPDLESLRQLRQQGVIVVEDACQAMLTSEIGDEADYVILSPRKFVGVVDGGVLRACHGRTLPPNILYAQASMDSSYLKSIYNPTFPVDPGIALDMYRKAAEFRAFYDREQDSENWFAVFQHAESLQPCGPYAMSKLTIGILHSVLDWSEIIRIRRENFLMLWHLMPQFAFSSHITPGVVPLGFPIVLENRDEVQQALFAERIYPPVHWHLAGHVPSEFTAAHQLSARIMTLPCDQRYDAADMQRMAEIVLRKGRPCSAT